MANRERERLLADFLWFNPQMTQHPGLYQTEAKTQLGSPIQEAEIQALRSLLQTSQAHQQEAGLEVE